MVPLQHLWYVDMGHMVVIKAQPFTIRLFDVCCVVSRRWCLAVMTDSCNQVVICPPKPALLALICQKALLYPAHQHKLVYGYPSNVICNQFATKRPLWNLHVATSRVGSLTNLSYLCLASGVHWTQMFTQS